MLPIWLMTAVVVALTGAAAVLQRLSRRLRRRCAALDAALDRRSRELRHALAVADAAVAEHRAQIVLTEGVVAELRRGLDAVAALSASTAAAPAHSHVAGQVRGAIVRLDGLVARLLPAAARPPQRLDARLILQTACDQMADSARVAGIRLETPDRLALSEPPPTIRADQAALLDILSALLEAAVGQARRGAVIRTSVHAVDGRARLGVLHLGGPVERRGVDLALLRRRAEALGGWIEVETGDDQGRAVLSLPLADAAPPAPSLEGVVLCVEPESVNRLMLRTLFADHGLTIHMAATLAEGARLARDLAPDLIVLDGADAQAARRLRVELAADPLTRDIAVIGLGAGLRADEATAARAAGFDAWLTRPVSSEALAHAAARALGDRPRLSRVA